jgi:hypothetical protein
LDRGVQDVQGVNLAKYAEGIEGWKSENKELSPVFSLNIVEFLKGNEQLLGRWGSVVDADTFFY